MLYLQFYVDDDRYIIATDNVVEVMPLVSLQRKSNAPEYICGMAVYRGHSLPVVDLCRLLIGRPCKQRLSSRIVVADVRHGGNVRRLGFMVEKMTGTVKFENDAFLSSGVVNPGTPYLHEVVIDDAGMAQDIRLEEVLDNTAYELLFSEKDRAV